MTRWRARQALLRRGQISPSAPVPACPFATADQSVSDQNKTPGKVPGFFVGIDVATGLVHRGRITVAPKSTSISGCWLTKIIQLLGMGERMSHERRLTHYQVSDARYDRANCERARY